MNKKNRSVICGVLFVVVLQLSLFIQTVKGDDDPEMRFWIQYPTDATVSPVAWDTLLWPSKEGSKPPTTGGVVIAISDVSVPAGWTIAKFDPGTLEVEYFPTTEIMSPHETKKVKSKNGQWEQFKGSTDNNGLPSNWKIAVQQGKFAASYITIGTTDFRNEGCNFYLEGASVEYTAPNPNGKDKTPIVKTFKFSKVRMLTIKVQNLGVSSLLIQNPMLRGTEMTASTRCGFKTRANYGFCTFDPFNPSLSGAYFKASSDKLLVGSKPVTFTGDETGEWSKPSTWGPFQPLNDDISFISPYVLGKNDNIRISATLGSTKYPDLVSSLSSAEMGYLKSNNAYCRLAPVIDPKTGKTVPGLVIEAIVILRSDRFNDAIPVGKIDNVYLVNGLGKYQNRSKVYTFPLNALGVLGVRPKIYPKDYSGEVEPLKMAFEVPLDQMFLLSNNEHTTIGKEILDSKGKIDPKKLADFGIVVNGSETLPPREERTVGALIRPLGLVLKENDSISAARFANPSKKITDYNFSTSSITIDPDLLQSAP